PVRPGNLPSFRLLLAPVFPRAIDVQAVLALHQVHQVTHRRVIRRNAVGVDDDYHPFQGVLVFFQVSTHFGERQRRLLPLDQAPTVAVRLVSTAEDGLDTERLARLARQNFNALVLTALIFPALVASADSSRPASAAYPALLAP